MERKLKGLMTLLSAIYSFFGVRVLAADSIIKDPAGGSTKDYLPSMAYGITALIFRLQNIVFVTAGGVAVAMIIWGAIVLTTAGGNEEKTAKGKKILTYAIGGIVFIVSSYTLINIFIRLLGGSVT